MFGNAVLLLTATNEPRLKLHMNVTVPVISIDTILLRSHYEKWIPFHISSAGQCKNRTDYVGSSPSGPDVPRP